MTHKSVQVSKNLFVDQELFQFLMNNDSIITNLLINLDFGDDFNYLAPTDSHDKISYLPIGKFSDNYDFDPYAKGVGRVTLKIGRFINKFIPQNIMDKFDISKSSVEKFVNLYKSWFDTSKYVLKIVEGEEIRKWYNEKNYYSFNGYRNGSLWNSCMRYEKRMKFLDLYCTNPKIKMLVMLQQNDNEWLVRSRALLWEDVDVTKDFSGTLPDKIKVMDRIYSVFDSDVNTFKKWAFENGYIPKFEQNAKSHQFFDIKGEIVRISCVIDLDNGHFGSFPYLDTFPYFNLGKKQISNDEYKFNWDYKLVQADGTLEREPQEEENNDDNEDW